MATESARRLFPVAEYYRMAEAGILTPEEDRVESIAEEIVEMTPIGRAHALRVNRLAALLLERSRELAMMSIQHPIRLGEPSEPRPDRALLAPTPRLSADAHPGPEEILLAIEVADSSRRFDRRVKLPLYARARGIREAWLVDLTTRAVEGHRAPGAEGYGVVTRVERGGPLAPLAFPDEHFSPAAFLP
jgi:Uma2 family endonuclease